MGYLKKDLSSNLSPSSYFNLFEDKSKILLNNPWYFSIFMLFVILGVLINYRWLQLEIIPTIILSALWLLFWKNSELNGKVFLIIASIFGFAHEILGVKYGYFTYLGGVLGGVPIWILPGYGAIFWSSYNLWHVFDQKYSKKWWYDLVNYFIPVSFAVMLVVDYVMFDLLHNPVTTLLKFSLAFLLFKTFAGLKLAYFVGFFTVLTEFTGEMLGTWTHPDFSLFSLMSGYIFLLWICLTISDVMRSKRVLTLTDALKNEKIFTLADSLKIKKDWGRIEAMSAIVLTIIYTLSMLGIAEV